MKKCLAFFIALMLLMGGIVDAEAATVKLNTTSATIKAGKTKQLRLLNSTSSKSWWSSDTTIAKVSKSGKVTAVKAGSTYIKARIKGKSKTYKCKVTVKAWLSNSNVMIKAGKSKTLTLKGTTIKSFSAKDESLVSMTKTSASKLKVTTVKEGLTKVKIKGANNKTYTCTFTIAAALSSTSIIITPDMSRKVTLKGTPTTSIISDDSQLATVTDKGVITGKAIGTTYITYYGSNGALYVCQVKVAEPKLNKKSATLTVPEKMTLKVKDTEDKPTFKSSNSKVAKITSKGKVTTLKSGDVTLTAKTSNRTLTCQLRVNGLLNATHHTMIKGKTFKLKLRYATLSSYASSDTAIAKVGKTSGKITAVAVGECTITATDTAGHTYDCQITVKKKAKAVNNEVNLTVGTTASAKKLLGIYKGIFKSSRQGIALVDRKTGIIVPVSAGTCTITNTKTSKKLKVIVEDNEHVKTGIDVSKWQDDIYVQELKKRNIDFVILRAGHGTGKDEKFKSFITKLYDNEMPFGIYWYLESHSYSRAMSVNDAKVEAKKLVDMIKPYKNNKAFNEYFQLPLYMDMESQSITKGYSTKASKAAHCQALVTAFTEVLDKNGYHNYSIYAGKYWAETNLSNSYFANYANKFWHARYNYLDGDLPTFTIDGIKIVPQIWQVGSGFSVAGTKSTNTDVDYLYIP